ncbi:MAG TPA: SRPBCC family protein [Nocardioides sp.]|nr:SRPBCC family protein [Nocardioides sp.]
MSSFTLSRETTIDAPPERVHGILDDFRQWQGWSPWEEIDPDLKRTYAGPARGVGAHYAWKGNKKVGSGSMEITASTPERVEVDLTFIEPFKAENKAVFDLVPSGTGTRVVWTMTGERNLAVSLMGKLFLDRAIAKDFDRGLARLKGQAEAAA